jgi:hypothetical protein
MNNIRVTDTRQYQIPKSLPVLNIRAIECDLLEVEVAANAEGADHVVDKDVHLWRIFFYTGGETDIDILMRVQYSQK